LAKASPSRPAERPGLYCRVLREGTVQTGDAVAVEPNPGETATLIEVYRDWYEKTTDVATLRRFLRAPLAIRAGQALEARLANLLDAG